MCTTNNVNLIPDNFISHLYGLESRLCYYFGFGANTWARVSMFFIFTPRRSTQTKHKESCSAGRQLIWEFPWNMRLSGFVGLCKCRRKHYCLLYSVKLIRTDVTVHVDLKSSLASSLRSVRNVFFIIYYYL